MLKTARFIVLYSLTVIQVNSKDPINLKQIKLIARNEKPLVVVMNPRNHLIKYYDNENNKDREIEETNSFNNYEGKGNNNKKMLAKLLVNFSEYYNGDKTHENIERSEPHSINSYESEGSNINKILAKLLENLDEYYNDDESNEDRGRKELNTLNVDEKLNKLLAKLLANLNYLHDGDSGEYESDDDEQTLEETAKDQAKYLSYNFLRTSPDDDSDFEETKQLLRQALRSRCNKVDNCAKQCKVSKPTCPFKCQIIYDEENLCEPPKCRKPSCGRGRTMPPKWLL